MTNSNYISRDSDIRAALRIKLTDLHGCSEDAFVVEELPISRGGARIDMAVINGRIEGFEIKSALDTLDRLETQARYYAQALERVNLVLAPKHLDDAIQRIPAWWGIFLAEIGSQGAIRLRRIRQGRLNPSITPLGCAGMLERDELLSLLAFYGQDRGYRTATRKNLTQLAAERIPLKILIKGVRDQLKKRTAREAISATTAFGRSAIGGGLSPLRVIQLQSTDA